MMESFGNNNEKVPLSEELPKQFNNLAGAQSYDNLTEPQIKSAISKYRDVLQRTRASIATSSPSQFLETFRVCPDTLGRITKFSKHEPN